MPVPDALCIIFACPVVTIILSAFILGDKLNSLKCFAGTLLFLGVVLVCQPPFLFPKNTFFLSPSTFLFSAHSGLFYVGVILASTGCVTGGLMDVLIAKCQVCSILTVQIFFTLIFLLGCLYSSSCWLVSHLRSCHHHSFFSRHVQQPNSFFQYC